MEKYRKNISILKPFAYIVVCICFSLYGCSPQSLHEAQAVVSAADSLRAEGQLYSDSMRLAKAYETLNSWQLVYPDAYAHACYHYGRLLRNADNPVAAMQVFINATHSHTRDYHILGRMYSNMGSICHLAGEYDLSYDMYEYSAEMFLQNGDTLLYYYLLNDMAVELSEQGKKEETLSLINIIQQQCFDPDVVLRTYETIADLYRITENFDSAVYWINQTEKSRYITPLGIIIKAQCFYRLGIYDSALYYARLILDDSLSIYQDKFNALYIISHCDSSLGSENIRQIASLREDIRYYEYEPEKEKLTAAVQLLEQDINRAMDWREWLVVALVISFGIISTISIILWRRRKQVIENRVKTLADTYADDIITFIKQHIDINDLNQTLHWKNYSAMKSDADLYMGGIVSKLETYKLNEVEIRFCILTVLDMKLKQIADIIHYSYPSGIKTLKRRIADKLGTTPLNLKEFIFKMLTNTL